MQILYQFYLLHLYSLLYLCKAKDLFLWLVWVKILSVFSPPDPDGYALYALDHIAGTVWSNGEKSVCGTEGSGAFDCPGVLLLWSIPGT